MKYIILLITLFFSVTAQANLFTNAGFESGNVNWTASSGTITNSGNQAAHSGTYKLWLNGYGNANTESGYQNITIPADAATAILKFWLHIDTLETTTTTAYDTLQVKVGFTTGEDHEILATYSNLNAASGYVEKTFDLAAYKGQQVRITFVGTEDTSLKTSFVIDDVSLNGAASSGGGNQALNPGFESGHANWNESTGTEIRNDKATHAGSWAAWVGGTGAINTRSIYQGMIFTPEDSITLKFWMHIETDETTTNAVYDTFKVQIQDSNGTVLETLATYSNLDKNTGWVEKTFDISAYSDQAIRLAFVSTEDSSLKTWFAVDDVSVNFNEAGGNNACAPAPTSQTVVSVTSTGATANDSTDDTSAIQAAVNQVAGTGGTVTVPAGTFMINAITHVYLASNMTFKMEPGAILKAITNSNGGYALLLANDTDNLNIIGGTLQGDRATHTGTGGESGMGISVYTSDNLVIDGVTSKDMWGDGFYIGASPASTTNTNMKVCNVVAENNRRQGLSLISANGIVIQDSVFKNTNGTAPQHGLDVEPDAGHTVNNALIQNNEFSNNLSGGIKAYSGSGTAVITDLVIDGNVVKNNGAGGSTYASGIRLGGQSSYVTISNNTVQDNRNDGIEIETGASHNLIDNNNSTGNGGYGYQVYDSISQYNTLSNNTASGNAVACRNQGTGTTLVNNNFSC